MEAVSNVVSWIGTVVICSLVVIILFAKAKEILFPSKKGKLLTVATALKAADDTWSLDEKHGGKRLYDDRIVREAASLIAAVDTFVEEEK